MYLEILTEFTRLEPTLLWKNGFVSRLYVNTYVRLDSSWALGRVLSILGIQKFKYRGWMRGESEHSSFKNMRIYNTSQTKHKANISSNTVQKISISCQYVIKTIQVNKTA
jgi:hypothetical protein